MWEKSSQKSQLFLNRFIFFTDVECRSVLIMIFSWKKATHRLVQFFNKLLKNYMRKLTTKVYYLKQ
jgi:hypothetical protein